MLDDASDDDWLTLLDDDDNTAAIDKSSVVDRLAPAFAARHRQAREDVRRGLIPILHHTKQLHEAIRTDVFPGRAHALARLDDATRRFESATRRDMDAARAVYDNTKRALDALFSTLDDLLRQSDLLFLAFKTNMHEHVQRLRQSADQIPTDAERLIAHFDKKVKHLGAEDHAKAKENLLRGILEKY